MVLLFDCWKIVSNRLCRLHTNPATIHSFIIHLVSSWNLLPTRQRLNGETQFLIYWFFFFNHSAWCKIVFSSCPECRVSASGVPLLACKWSNAVYYVFIFIHHCFKSSVSRFNSRSSACPSWAAPPIKTRRPKGGCFSPPCRTPEDYRDTWNDKETEGVCDWSQTVNLSSWCYCVCVYSYSLDRKSVV